MNPDPLNVPCPYCKRQCRIGMSHDCEQAPEGCREILVSRRGGKIVAYVFGVEG